MSHVTVTRHIWMSHVTATPHTWMSHVTHKYESCHACQWVVSPMQMSHVTVTHHVWMSHVTATLHIWMSHVTHKNESCHICQWVVSPVQMSHVTIFAPWHPGLLRSLKKSDGTNNVFVSFLFIGPVPDPLGIQIFDVTVFDPIRLRRSPGRGHERELQYRLSPFRS